MEFKEDFGNLGNLVEYLNGKEPLEERIKKAHNIFFLTANIPPQHKEEVVILWLADILSTNKILNFTNEEVKEVWTSLRTLLCSKRLKALCSHHWVCCFTSTFIQTLVTTVSETTTASDIKHEAFLICECLMNTPTLSPQISNLTNQSISLCSSMVLWAKEKPLSPSQCSFLTLLFQKSFFIATYRMSTFKTTVLIYQKMLLPSLELFLHLKDSSVPEVTELIKMIRKFLYVLFGKSNEKTYYTLLKLPMNEESKEHLSIEGESFYGFLIECISGKDKEVAMSVLQEFACCFFNSYKKHPEMCFQFVINTMYLIGISLKKGPTVEENSIATQTLTQVNLGETNRVKLTIAILEALLHSSVDLNQCIGDTSLQNWIQYLAQHLLHRKNPTSNTSRCLILILKLDPMCIMSIPDFFTCLLAFDRSTDEAYAMFDNLLWEILEINVRLRTVEKMYEQLCRGLSDLRGGKASVSMWTGQSFFYDGNQVFPSNFMKNFMSSIRLMGTQMCLNFGSSIQKILSGVCRSALKTEVDSDVIASIATTVWVSSCCLSATTLVEAASVSGMAQNVAHLMNGLAENCIKPLVQDMLKIKELDTSLLCISLLNLCLVWSELQTNLMFTETGYLKHTSFALTKKPWESDSVTDFSTQIPFLSADIWAQIFGSCLRLKEDRSRFWVLQLLFQKISKLEVDRMENAALSIAFDSDRASAQLRSLLDAVFEVEDTMTLPLSTDLVAFHLHSLLPLLEKNHLGAAARMFVCGISEERESWLRFGQSLPFKECSALHASVLSLLCARAASLLRGGKRKSGADEEGEGKKTRWSADVFASLIEDAQVTGLEGSHNKRVAACFALIEEAMKGSFRPKLGKRSESEVLGLLRVVDTFPLSFLQPKLMPSVVSFVLTLILEEGGLKGRRSVTSHALRLLNRLAACPLAGWTFRKNAVNPLSLLDWLLAESQHVLQDFAIQDSHLGIVLGDEEPAARDGSPLGDLIYLMNGLTRFMVADLKEDLCCYAQSLVREEEEAGGADIRAFAALMLCYQVRKAFPTVNKKKTPVLLSTLRTLSHACLEEAQGVDLSRVTNTRLANYLSTFTTLLVVNEVLRNREENSKRKGEKWQRERKVSIGGEGNAKEKVCEAEKEEEMKEEERMEIEEGEKEKEEEKEDLESKEFGLLWHSLVSCGARLASLASQTEMVHLRMLSLDFYSCVTCFSKTNKSPLGNMSSFLSAWRSTLFGHPTHNHCIKSVFQHLLPNNYKQFLNNLMKETLKKPLDVHMLSQWLTVIVTDCPPGSDKKKSRTLTQLTATLCLTTANQISSDAMSKVIKIFVAILKKEKSISAHSKSLILNACFKVSSNQSSTESFLQMFEGAVRILTILMVTDFTMVSDRPASIMSALSHLTLAMMDHVHQHQDLDEKQVKRLLKGCFLLEKTSKDLRNYDIYFFKIIPFSIGKIVEKIQQSTLYPVVKESMERIIFNLLDLSDFYSLQHLLVTLSPSVISLLKHYHSIFSNTIQFTPNKF